MKKIIKIMKENNMEEFDFDDLLNELSEPEVQLETKEEKKEPEVEQVAEPVITEEVPEPIVEVSNNAIPEPDPQSIIDDLNVEISQLKDKLKAVENIQSDRVVENVVSDYEYSNEAKSFLKDFNDIEMQKRGLAEKQKELKEEAKEAGVDVAATLKARKAVIEEMKETSDEAQIIEQMKESIRNDDSLMIDSQVFAG